MCVRLTPRLPSAYHCVLLVGQVAIGGLKPLFTPPPAHTTTLPLSPLCKCILAAAQIHPHRSRCALHPPPPATCTLVVLALPCSTGCMRARLAASLCSGGCRCEVPQGKAGARAWHVSVCAQVQQKMVCAGRAADSHLTPSHPSTTHLLNHHQQTLNQQQPPTTTKQD